MLFCTCPQSEKVKTTKGETRMYAQVHQLPEPLVREIDDYVNFLLIRSNTTLWQMWLQFTEALNIAESDMPDYLPNLEDYENRLARGEIQW
jgi:hypothetical protein